MNINLEDYGLRYYEKILRFQFWRYNYAKLLKYIKDTLKSARRWKDGTNDKYGTGFQTVIAKQSGKLGQNGSDWLSMYTSY